MWVKAACGKIFLSQQKWLENKDSMRKDITEPTEVLRIKAACGKILLSRHKWLENKDNMHRLIQQETIGG